jgi:mannosyltransferase
MLPRGNPNSDHSDVSAVPTWQWIVVLSIGVVLRCIYLSRPSLWLDEAASYYFVSGDFARALRSEKTNPPLYYLLLYFWTQLFGFSEIALRSLSVVASCALLAVYAAFVRVIFPQSIALLGLLLLAISPFHIYYAQEARCFALMSFFITCAAWSLVTIWKNPRRHVSYLFLFLASLASVYTHFIAVFFVAAFAVVAALLHWRQARTLKAILTCLVLTGICFAPWIVTMLEAAGGGGQVRHHLLLKVPQTFFSFLYGDSLIPLDEAAVQSISNTLKSYTIVLVAAVGVGLFVAISLFKAFREHAQHRLSLVICAILCMLPVAAAFIVSFKIMLFDERYLVAASLFLYPLVAAGIILGMSRIGGFCVLLIHLTLLATSLYGYYYNPRFGREQWREVAAFLQEANQNASTIVCDVGYVDVPFLYYYSTPTPTIRAINDYSAPSPPKCSWHDQILSLDSFWLIRSHVEGDGVLDTIRRDFSIVLHRHYSNGRGIDVYKLESNGK